MDSTGCAESGMVFQYLQFEERLIGKANARFFPLTDMDESRVPEIPCYTSPDQDQQKRKMKYQDAKPGFQSYSEPVYQ